MFSALVDGAVHFCGRAALLIHKGDQLLGFRIAGAVEPEAGGKLAREAGSREKIEHAERLYKRP